MKTEFETWLHTIVSSDIINRDWKLYRKLEPTITLEQLYVHRYNQWLKLTKNNK